MVWKIFRYALGLCLLFSTSAFAAPLAGVDCACSKVGDYVLPTQPVETKPANGTTSESPGHTYTVSAVSAVGGGALVTVLEDGAPVLQNLPGVSWGFSPDDDRFVLYRVEATLTYAYLYNLKGPTPQQPILAPVDVSRGGLIAFSPHGQYAVAMSFSAAGPNILDITVANAETGSVLHSNTIGVYTPSVLPTTLPQGHTLLGAVRVGFGPDDTDRSFVYAWVDNANQQTHWALAKLDQSPPLLLNSDPSQYGFTWGFSPCGDRYGVVTSNVDTQLKVTRLYSTLDHSLRGQVEFPVTDDSFLDVNASEHRVHHGLSGLDSLAANNADTSCATSAPPSAAFTFASPYRVGIPIPFTNKSTGSGQLSYTWSFGDGDTSTLANPAHTYLASGTFTVSLTAKNEANQQATIQHDVTVAPNNPPTPAFAFSPPNPSSRDLVTFTSTSTDDDGIATTEWVINGRTYSGNVVQAKVCAPSTPVQLTVFDHANQYAEVTQTIDVGGTDRVSVPPGGDLTAADQAACPGDTLVLAKGIYPGGAFISQTNLEGAGPGQTVINGAGPTGWALGVQGPSTDFPLSFTKLTVRGGQLLTDSDGHTKGGGIVVISPAELLLDQVEVTANQGRAGVLLDDNDANVTVRNSSIHDNTADGVVVSLSHITVEGSQVYGNETGLAVNEAAADITQSDFYDNRHSGLNMSGSGGFVYQTRIYRNGIDGAFAFTTGGSIDCWSILVANNFGGGIDIGSGAIIGNSTIAFNCGTGILADNSRLYNSIVYGNGLDMEGTPTASSGNLVGVDPVFAGPSDYHLSPSSPAIDQGDLANLPSLIGRDGDGDPRVLASGAGMALLDIGWDEWRPDQPTAVLPAAACGQGTGGTSNGGATSVASSGTVASTGGNGGLESAGGTTSASEGGASGDFGLGGFMTVGGVTATGGTHNAGATTSTGGAIAQGGGGTGELPGTGGTSIITSVAAGGSAVSSSNRATATGGSVTAAAGTPAGSLTAPIDRLDAGDATDAPQDGSCGCRVIGTPRNHWTSPLLGALAALLLSLRRRRRAPAVIQGRRR